MPGKTFSRVEFSPWLQRSFDANDTVGESDWYQTAHYYARSGYCHTGRNRRRRKAFLHNNTPVISHFDSLGRVFFKKKKKKKKKKKSEADTGTEKLTTRLGFDIEGKELQLTDALDRITLRYDYDLLGRCIKKFSLDAGTRFYISDAGNNS